MDYFVKEVECWELKFQFHFIKNSFQDYEFVIYVNRPETIQIVDRNLKMTPVLSEQIYGSGFVTSDFNLGEK